MDQNTTTRPQASGPIKPGGVAGTSATSSQSLARRLRTELSQMLTTTAPGIAAFVEGDDLYTWTGSVEGPPGSPYAGLKYKLLLKFPSTYPYTAPTVLFVSACYHPNVHEESGTICLDILKDKWSAVYSVQTILLSIQSLLGEPNPESPLNPQAAALWADQRQYARVVADKHASGSRTTASA